MRVREATPEDDDAVVALITDYLNWAHTILREQYGLAVLRSKGRRRRDGPGAEGLRVTRLVPNQWE
jgi:hypothetical protein